MIIDIGIFPLVYYITLTIGAICVIYISYDIQRKYRPKYLSVYFYYLIAIHVYLYLLINLPPLFYIKGYLNRHLKESVFGQVENFTFKHIFDAYGLTRREQEISVLMTEGKGNKGIADELYISVKTVRNHIYNIFQKFKVNNRTKFFILVRNLIDEE